MLLGLLCFAIATSAYAIFYKDTKRLSIGRSPIAIATGVQMQVGFDEIEDALSKVSIHESGQLSLDARTESALAGATIELPPDLSKQTLDRIEFLIRKGLPGTAGEDLATSFGAYYRYMRVARELSAAGPALPDLDSEIKAFEKISALRVQHFGPPIAHQLFGEQHALAQYTFALRRLEDDSTLSAQQKELRQRQLQEQYDSRHSLAPR
ncbi:MAG: hypothetical protein H7Y02_05780 [Candidatus Obscuribacterales bacterium]|nr:hypothetical protein [Steroidobacteraceae bacterium]